jgi:hypothetical protein
MIRDKTTFVRLLLASAPRRHGQLDRLGLVGQSWPMGLSAVDLVASAACPVNGGSRRLEPGELLAGEADGVGSGISWSRSRRRVPGMGTIQGRWASSHASAICAGVALCSAAIWRTVSTIGWLAARASWLKRGEPAAHVGGRELLRLVDRAGEEGLTEPAPGNESDAQLVACRKYLGLGVAGPQRVLVLDGGDGLDGACPANSSGADQVVADRERIAEMTAAQAGAPAPAAESLIGKLTVAASYDAELFRALIETVLCLAPPQEIVQRPGLREKIESLSGLEPIPMPGPDRTELLGLLDGA